MSRMTTAVEAVAGRAPGVSLPVWAVRAPLRLALWSAMRLGLRISVEGTRVPGPTVIASNHPNLLDGLVVLMADGSMRPVARWHRHRLVRFGLWIGNCVITSTGTPANPQRGAYARALAHLHAGGRVWIAPEGGWQPDVTLRPPRTGAVRLAHAAVVPIQVLAVCHTPHPGPDLSTLAGLRRSPLRRHRLVLRWGPCLTTTGDVTADGDRLMAAIAETAGMTWASAADAAAASLDRSAASSAR